MDIKKVVTQSLGKSHLEKQVEEYKLFYKTYFLKITNRNEVLSRLYPLCLQFYQKNPPAVYFPDSELLRLKAEAKEVINKYFGSEVLALFNKELPKPNPKKNYLEKAGDSFWLTLLASFAETMEAFSEKSVQEWNYQRNFIIFLNNCLANFGLHENILRRQPSEYKRYNLIVVHYYRSRKPLTVIKANLSFDEFNSQFTRLYLSRKPLKFDGLLIPFDKIYRVKITTTLLKEDEIELFALKNNFNWNSKQKDIEKFVHCCIDETEQYHPNPFDKDTYGNETDMLLVAQTKLFLKAYPVSLKTYQAALEKFGKRIYERNILDDLRLSLEDLLRQVLKNKKSLENQLSEIGKYQKAKGTSPEIVNMLQKLIDYYSQYQNNHVKHNDKVNEDEIEFVINITSTFMRFIAQKKDSL